VSTPDPHAVPPLRRSLAWAAALYLGGLATLGVLTFTLKWVLSPF
jgi:hypothetical protein